MSSLSAARISSESASCDEPEVMTSSNVSLDTADRSMFFLTVPTSRRILSASSASLMQYSMTLSLFSAHSLSMCLGSTSSFCSPRTCRATAFRVSCFGLSSLLAAHHASATTLPLTLQYLSPTSLGWLPSLPHERESFSLLTLALSEIFLMS